MKRLLSQCVMALAAIACLYGCQKQTVLENPAGITIMTQPKQNGEAPQEGSTKVTIAATEDWFAVADDGWMYVTPSSGHKGIQEVTIHFQTNTTGKSRKGTITFTSGSYSETYALSQRK